MSGGSYGYAYEHVEEMASKLDRRKASVLRRAFASHLRKVAKAMHDVEWADSGDTAEDSENDAIRHCIGIGPNELVGIDEAVKRLDEEIERAFGPKAPA